MRAHPRTSWPLFLVLTALGCGDSKPPAPAATTATARPAVTVTATAAATATAEATASAAPKREAPPLATGPELKAATCPKLTAALGSWLKVLHSEGPLVPAEPGISLVEANQAAGALPAAPRLTIGAARISIDGAPVAASKEPGFDAKEIGATLAKKVEAAKQAGGAAAAYVLLEIDRGAPWHAVVAAADAAAGAGVTYGTFLFAAPTTASAPPASAHHSSFHKAFGAGAEKPAAILSPAEEGSPGPLADIYKECPAAAKVKHAPSEELAKELPKAIAACNCKVDMAGVQALAWLVYDRYSGVARTGLTVNLAKEGTAGAFEVGMAAATPWAEASTPVREAAGKGKPVKLAVK